jgi:hypothetical protein
LLHPLTRSFHVSLRSGVVRGADGLAATNRVQHDDLVAALHFDAQLRVSLLKRVDVT